MSFFLAEAFDRSQDNNKNNDSEKRHLSNQSEAQQTGSPKLYGNRRSGLPTDTSKPSYLVSSVDGQPPLEEEGLHDVPCGDCNRSYNGQCCRVREHGISIGKDMKSSPLAQYTTCLLYTSRCV